MAHGWIKGSELTPTQQRQALARFVHRFTADHVPQWAGERRPDGTRYMVQFADDADWLAHTEFAMTAAGRFDERVRYCRSTPTWPHGQADTDATQRQRHAMRQTVQS